LKDMLRVQKNGIIENIQLKFKKQEKLWDEKGNKGSEQKTIIKYNRVWPNNMNIHLKYECSKYIKWKLDASGSHLWS
jgi:hypothetical protein